MVLFATFSTARAAAQAPSEASIEERDARARALYQAGEAAFNVGHYESAMELFLEAYSLSNRATLLYNLGHTADRLRRDDDAIRYFERFLAEASANDGNRLPATQRLAALQQAAAARALAAQAEAERLAAIAADAETRRLAEAEAARVREAELAQREADQLAERQDAEFRAVEAEARAAQASRQAEEAARQAAEAERLAEEARRQQQGHDIAQEPAFWVVLVGGLALAGGGVALGLVLSQPQRVLGDDGESHPALTVRFDVARSALAALALERRARRVLRPTQVVIVVTADSQVTMTGVRELQFRAEGSNGVSEPFELTDETTVTQAIHFPYRFVVERLGESEARRYAVTLHATLSDGRVVRAQRVSTYVEGEVRQIYMHLEDTCANVRSCETFGFTCSGGECVSAMVLPNVIPPLGADANEDAALDRLDGAVMADAAMDAGVIIAPDARSDAFIAPDAALDAWSEFDAGVDAALPPDVGMDAGSDTGMDAGSDAGTDAFSPADAGMDAFTFDVGRDAFSPIDTGVDATFDGGRDALAPIDARPDTYPDATLGLDAHDAPDALDSPDAWSGVPDIGIDAPDAPSASHLFINEVDYQGSDDFIEFYNGTDAPIDLVGYQLVILGATCITTLVAAPFPGGSIVEAGDVYFVRPGDIPSSPSISLIGPGSVVVDSVSFRSDSGCGPPYAHVVDVGDPESAQRQPDGDSGWVVTRATQGASNGH